MKCRLKALSWAVANVMGAGVILSVASGGALAQQAQRIEKIEVTGSNIKRVEGEGPSAIVVITRDDIEKSGATNAYELMNLVSANNSSGNVSAATVIGASTFSAVTASLRGLGGGRTLVLLNGKRLNTFAGEISGVQGVNLSTIPLNAIERVEVLLDGASAIYGSDAVAGVINFIMRKDYRGAEASVYYGTPTRGGPGGDQTTFKAALGFGDLSKDRFNVFVAAAHDKQDALEQRHRNFSNNSVLLDLGLVGISGTPFPAYVSTRAPGGPPVGSIGFPDCGVSTFFPELGAQRCFYDPARQAGVQSIPELTTTNIFGAATFQITNNLQAYLTGNFSKAENHNIIQPVPIADIFGDPITLQPGTPFYPTAAATAAGVNGLPLNVRWRAVESGNRDLTDTNEQWQVVGGLKGSFGKWDWDASINHNEGTTDEKLNGGFPLRSVIVPLLSSGRVNLFGPNTPEISAEIQAANYNGPTYSATAKATYFDAKVSGELFRMPSGPASLAFGVQVGAEEMDQKSEPVLATGDLTGFGGNILGVNQERDTRAIFAELNIPLTRTLEANVAVRHDNYSDFGNTTNPKYSLRWQPTRNLLLRASYGTGFLAPSLYQLYVPNTTGVSPAGLSDPLRCPTTDSTFDCFTQFGVTFGGNPTLQPEKSQQWSAGIVFEPAQGWSIGVDWFDLYLKETVSSGPSSSTILSNLGQFGQFVTRAPADPDFPTLPGRITNIDQRLVNLGGVKIQGLDANIQFAAPPTPVGRFRFYLSGTYLIKYDSQNLDGSYSGFVSNSLGAVTTGVTPRWKSYQAVTLDNGPFSVTLGNTYQSSYTDQGLDGNDEERTVSTLSLWDLQATWKAFRGLSLTLGAKNLLDTNPPASNQRNTFHSGYDPSYYDPRARVVYVQATYRFR